LKINDAFGNKQLAWPNLSRASESNDKVSRLEYWNQSLRITKIVAQNAVILSVAQALRAGGQ